MRRAGTVSDVRAVPPPGPHGDDAGRVSRALGVDPSSILDLAATLNPLAPDPAPVVRHHADAVRRYPDEGRARDRLAELLGVDRRRLVLTNGGAEAIAVVASLHPAGWVEEPDFSLYRRHLTRLEPDAPRWASNPRNPTGDLAGERETAFVWDEAFYPLATGRWTRGDRDSLVVGSLTKVLACPGLRLGYALARDESEAERLRRVRPAWSVNAVALAALPELLAPVDLPRWAADLARLRGALVECLDRHGLDPVAADAPWALARNATGLRERLAPHSVLVRDCASFGLPGVARVAVPDDDGLDRLDAALAASA